MIDKNHRVGVIGSGSYGTAIVKILTENCEKINWCVWGNSVRDYLKEEGKNPNYLKKVIFDVRQLNISTDVNQVVNSSDIIFLVTPSVHLHAVMKDLTTKIDEKLFVSAIKGIIPETNGVVYEYLNQKFGVKDQFQGALTGPCHAEEIALEKMSYLTLSMTGDHLKIAKPILESRYIKVTESDDVLGNEYGAILKNIYAIGVGLLNGLRFGENFKAVFLANALREMEVILNGLVGGSRKMNTTSILGDLLVTCYSEYSRNQRFGRMIGDGTTPNAAREKMDMVVEGDYATKNIYERGKAKGMEIPLIEAIYRVLFQNEDAKICFENLKLKLN